MFSAFSKSSELEEVLEELLQKADVRRSQAICVKFTTDVLQSIHDSALEYNNYHGLSYLQMFLKCIAWSYWYFLTFLESRKCFTCKLFAGDVLDALCFKK